MFPAPLPTLATSLVSNIYTPVGDTAAPWLFRRWRLDDGVHGGQLSPYRSIRLDAVSAGADDRHGATCRHQRAGAVERIVCLEMTAQHRSNIIRPLIQRKTLRLSLRGCFLKQLLPMLTLLGTHMSRSWLLILLLNWFHVCHDSRLTYQDEMCSQSR